MVDDNKDLKRKLIELDRILEDKIRERDAKVEATKLKMYDFKTNTGYLQKYGAGLFLC